jgi:hypothetical protein
MPRVILKIIIRPEFPKVNEIVLTGDISHLSNYKSEVIAMLLWDVERTLNEHMLYTRSHIDIIE